MRNPFSFPRLALLSLPVLTWAGPGRITGLLASTAMAEIEASPLPSDMIISSGDSWYIGDAFLPVDSPRAIHDSVKMWADALKLKRVYWRGEQEEMMIDFGLIRKDNLNYYDFFNVWERHLQKDLLLNQVFVDEAHRRGITVYFLAPLFDFCGPADAGGCAEYPYYGQLTLTLQHPEWMPVDRAGKRVQTGPIELAYPEARKALIDMYLYYVDRDKLDGISLFTYCENMALRFEDEFGYNQPIVDEYKRRYGADIRTQPFDKNLWRALRGEFVTQFLRELKAALQTRGKKLGIYDLDPREPNYPAPWWLNTVRTAGRIYLDWERWIREGIVDDVIINYGPDDLEQRMVENLFQAAQGRPVTIDLYLDGSRADQAHWHSDPLVQKLQPYINQGLRFALWCTSDASYLKMAYGPQTSDVLAGQDIYAVIRFLAQIAEGEATVDAGQIIPLARHENILVRRQALKALARLKDPRAVPVLEDALEDPESSVRSAAVFALADTHGPRSFAKVVALVGKRRDFQIFEAASAMFVSLNARDLPDLISLAHSPDPILRRMAVYVTKRRASPSGRPILLLGLKDADLYTRYVAAHGLQIFHHDPGVVDALLASLDDPSPVVQDRAAVSLAIVSVDGCTVPPTLRNGLESAINSLKTLTGPLPEIVLDGRQERVLQALVQKFTEFGDRSSRSDLDWGFRPVGNALLAFGATGGRRLQDMIDLKTDHRLAILAWTVLNIRQGVENFCIVPDSDETNNRIYSTYPTFEPVAKSFP